MKKNLDLHQPIFALVSGRPPTAVGVVRISGAQIFSILSPLIELRDDRLGHRRGMFYGTLKDREGRVIDRALILVFLAPSSFTGEDTVELQLHGSVAILRQVESLLISLGIRPAERGEFSYRAFLHDKMSLSEMEALGDVYLASDPPDLQRIYGRTDDSLALTIEGFRSELIRTQALLDTAVDFSEEYAPVIDTAGPVIDRVIHECRVIIHRYSSFCSGGRVPRIVLCGRPNAGKSSLFNALLARPRAIVHSEPGTTRDAIEEEIDLSGRRWKIVDTAGLRETNEYTESQGIEFAEAYLDASDFWILVVDGSEGMHGSDHRLLEVHGHRPHLVVWNKSDREDWKLPTVKGIPLSATSGKGVSDLWNALAALSVSAEAHLLSEPLPTAIQAGRLSEVERALVEMRAELDRGAAPEFVAELNRGVISRLESVIGAVSTEEVLDRVFRDFCIGK